MDHVSLETEVDIGVEEALPGQWRRGKIADSVASFVFEAEEKLAAGFGLHLDEA